ncbi:prolipoprotein diacylglyceryl transferase [bacterium (candidate division B38) B3_B38]|nr:MAG: prolipoprotein diacylglyceryl transferase [bacterium (candidate division B38) B3_B38]
MFPRLFKIGPYTQHTYGVILVAAFIIAILLAMRQAKKEGIPPARILDLGLVIIISALIGAKVLLILVNIDYYLEYPKELLTSLRLGGVFYGGLLTAILVGIWSLKRWGLPVWKVADILAPYIALGQGIGRWACFMTGCCYGKPTISFAGVVFTDPYAHQRVGVPLNISLHPTQLYHSLAGFALLAVLIILRRKKTFEGELFWSYILLYSITRFVIEFFRGDYRGSLFQGLLSTSQFIALLVIPLSIVMLLYLRRKQPLS